MTRLGGGAEALVLAADYRVVDPERWRTAVRDSTAHLERLGAHRVLRFEALDDPRHVFNIIGHLEGQPLAEVLRAGRILDWFADAGVEDIPPLFVGRVEQGISPVVGDSVLPPQVIVALLSPVADLDRFLDDVSRNLGRFGEGGARSVCVHSALDNGKEVLLVAEIDTETNARRWIQHADILSKWMAGLGSGIYPVPFVGRLIQLSVDP